MAKKTDQVHHAAGRVGKNDERPTFTIAIYQDPSYIEGIIQQSSRGLITDSSDTDNAQYTQSSNEDDGLHGDIGAEINVPGIGGFNASVGRPPVMESPMRMCPADRGLQILSTPRLTTCITCARTYEQRDC
jgi:hypothetical protein